MEKLKATLTQYSRWQPYGVYVDRMAGHLESDFSVSVENAKALLEGIGKEICDANCIALANAPAIGAVLKTAFRALDTTVSSWWPRCRLHWPILAS